MVKTRIEITNLDSSEDLIMSDNRPKANGQQTIDLVTDDFYKRSDEFEYKQQRVQTISWDKYKIELLNTEDYSIEVLNNAKFVKVFNANVIHNAKITSITRSVVSDTDFSNFTVEYYDVNLLNYKFSLPPVYEYLKSDALIEQFEADELTKLTVSNTTTGESNSYYTILEINQTTQAPQNAQFDNTQSGAKITTNTIIKNQYALIFYLNKTDIEPLQTLLPLADFGGKITANLYIRGGSAQVIQEVPSVNVEKVSGHDIYKCTVDFVNDITNFYNYK